MIVVALLLAGALADTPNDSEHVPVHAVMYEFDYDSDGNIRHAQAVGGYATMESCQGAMPMLMAAFSERVGPNRSVQLMCSSVQKRVVIGTVPKAET